MTPLKLSDSLIEHFDISEYKSAKSGGQKNVFIVTIENQKYALKIINNADDRFEREVKICNEFHKNEGIPKIIKIEKYDKDTIILEEYIYGNDLSDLLLDYKGDEKKVCQLIYDIGNILKPVWESKYVHRDLKPQNIRIKENGKPVVLDFGIARALEEDTITASGGQPLSYLFGSPEQYDGKKHLISYRTDFFCLGIIAFFLYAGYMPFGENRNDISQTFKDNNLNVCVESHYIESFCNSVFKINPSERPRKIETFLKIIEV